MHHGRDLWKIFDYSKKILDKRVHRLYNSHKSKKEIGSGKEEHTMRYAAISENMMMYMGMCRMCMRTLRYALDSEPFSTLGK